MYGKDPSSAKGERGFTAGRCAADGCGHVLLCDEARAIRHRSLAPATSGEVGSWLVHRLAAQSGRPSIHLDMRSRFPVSTIYKHCPSCLSNQRVIASSRIGNGPFLNWHEQCRNTVAFSMRRRILAGKKQLDAKDASGPAKSSSSKFRAPIASMP